MEVTIHQDLAAAMARLNAARRWAETYRNQVLPEFEKSLDGIQQLFAKGEPSADVLRVLDVRRKLLKARDPYLDALWEVRQAQADLAAAVGDPIATLTDGETSPVPKPQVSQPSKP